MSDLTTMVAALKREVSTPGDFDTLFPDAATSDLVGSLKDGFWSAKLDGWFPDAVIDTSGNTTPDLSGEGLQLVVIYAAKQIITNQLRNQPTRQQYKVGTLETVSDYGATVLKNALDDIQSRIKDLLTYARYGRGTTVSMHDAYIARGLYEHEWTRFAASTELPY
jgi:hypothetical protein